MIFQTIEKEYDDSFSALEICGYSLILFYLFFFFGLKNAFFLSPFFLVLFRASVWDYRYKVVPSYLLLSSFFASLMISYKEFPDSISDGLIFIGATFLLNQIAEIYLDLKYQNSEEKNIFIGEGDIPIIGAIGVIFDIKVGISCLLLAMIILLLVNLITRKKELAFIPALFFSILFHYLYNEEIISLSKIFN